MSQKQGFKNKENSLQNYVSKKNTNVMNVITLYLRQKF
jgi:hypothetical protein